MKRLFACLALFLIPSLCSALEIKDVVKGMKNSIVTVTVETKNLGRSTGTGFAFQAPNLIVTNHHVIADAAKIEIHNINGKTFRLKQILKDDSLRDLAVLELSESTLTPIPRVENCEVGEKVVAIGSSLGVLEFSVSDGIISSFRGSSASFNRAVQTTAPISPGNSGGPLLTLEGKVVGVNTFTLVKGQNINFAVPIDYVEKLLNPDAEVTQVNKQEISRILCQSCKTEIENPEKTKFCPNCGAKFEVQKVGNKVPKAERMAKFNALLSVIRENSQKINSPFSLDDSLLIAKTLDDIDPNNSVVKAMLSMNYALRNEKANAEENLSKSKRLLSTSATKDPEITKRAEFLIENMWGDDKKGREIIKTLDKNNPRNAALIKAMSNQGKDGTLLPPMSEEKVERLKKTPKMRVPLNIGDYNFELWIYERFNPMADIYHKYRYLVLIFINKVYYWQANFFNRLPNEMQMKSELIKLATKQRENTLQGWKELENNPKYKEILPYFPEFDGIGWVKEFK